MSWDDVYIQQAAKAFVAVLLNPWKFWEEVMKELDA